MKNNSKSFILTEVEKKFINDVILANSRGLKLVDALRLALVKNEDIDKEKVMSWIQQNIGKDEKFGQEES